MFTRGPSSSLPPSAASGTGEEEGPNRQNRLVCSVAVTSPDVGPTLLFLLEGPGGPDPLNVLP